MKHENFYSKEAASKETPGMDIRWKADFATRTRARAPVSRGGSDMAAFKDRRSECDTKTSGGLLWKSSGFVSPAGTGLCRMGPREVTTSFLTYIGTAGPREKEKKRVEEDIFPLKQSLHEKRVKEIHISFTAVDHVACAFLLFRWRGIARRDLSLAITNARTKSDETIARTFSINDRYHQLNLFSFSFKETVLIFHLYGN